MNSSKLLQWAALSGLIAVMLGAFGAHGLKPLIDEKTLHAYNTAVLYHFLHTLALLSLALWKGEKSGSYFTWSLRLFLAGMLGFSGFFVCNSLKQGSWNRHFMAGACNTIGWATADGRMVDAVFTCSPINIINLI
jgi:uncharacterized membrane protein YgdD (TMEM256/DUF423 family)